MQIALGFIGLALILWSVKLITDAEVKCIKRTCNCPACTNIGNKNNCSTT